MRQKLQFSFILLTFSLGILHAKENDIHQTHPSGVKSLNICKVTGSDLICDQGLNGQGYKAAIFDSFFLPEHTSPLLDKEVLDPSTLKNLSTILPGEFKSTYADLFIKFAQKPTYKQTIDLYGDKIVEKLEDNPIIVDRRAEVFNNSKFRDKTTGERDSHGSGVMECIHKIAPKARLLPLDPCVFQITRHDILNVVLEKVVDVAIDSKVDVINFSTYIKSWDEDSFKILKRLPDHGILCVFAAGNDNDYLRNDKDYFNAPISPSVKQKIFDHFKGEGILFAGSSGYTPEGQEVVSAFTNHPDSSTESHFLVAPGEKLPIFACDELKNGEIVEKLVDGTSFSAPVITGAYLDIKQHCATNNYDFSRDDIKNIMIKSGRELPNLSFPQNNIKTYKSLDIPRAIKFADHLFSLKKLGKTISKVIPKII